MKIIARENEILRVQIINIRIVGQDNYSATLYFIFVQYDKQSDIMQIESRLGTFSRETLDFDLYREYWTQKNSMEKRSSEFYRKKLCVWKLQRYALVKRTHGK